MLDLGLISDSAVMHEPFSYFMASGVLNADSLRSVGRDFPPITAPGIFPLDSLRYGTAFERLIDDIRNPDLESIMARKLGVELADKPLMITVRGHCQLKDGQIHTDSIDKIATCLLYLNEDWPADGGRLRLLRNAHDMDGYIAEIPPVGGTLVAFRRSANSWHGHLPFAGPRRYVMFNWVQSRAALTRNVTRHRITARLKRLGISR